MTKSLPKKTVLLLTCFALLMGCTSENESCPKCIGQGENLIYGDQGGGGIVQEIDPALLEESSNTVDEEFLENKEKIEEKFGEQWDFCRCVIANDSLDRVVKSGAEIGDDFMKRFEEVDQKCKAFLVMSPNQTPQERADHEKKTKNCLKNAKRN